MKIDRKRKRRQKGECRIKSANEDEAIADVYVIPECHVENHIKMDVNIWREYWTGEEGGEGKKRLEIPPVDLEMKFSESRELREINKNANFPISAKSTGFKRFSLNDNNF